MLNRLEIYLSFAAAGDAVEQNGLTFAEIDRLVQHCQDAELAWIHAPGCGRDILFALGRITFCIQHLQGQPSLINQSLDRAIAGSSRFEQLRPSDRAGELYGYFKYFRLTRYAHQ